MKKPRPLQLSINITTGYAETGDAARDEKIRLDQTSYYLSTLFWFMNTACKGYDLLDLETEHKLFTFPEFRGHVEIMSEIGNAIAERLTVYSVAVNEQSEVKDNV